jgi:hypothetical protein
MVNNSSATCNNDMTTLPIGTTLNQVGRHVVNNSSAICNNDMTTLPIGTTLNQV